MLVRKIMTRHGLMVEPSMPLSEAQSSMSEENVRYAPVVDDGKRLRGLISRKSLLVQPAKLSSLNVWEITRHLSDLKVRDVMIKKVFTVESTATVEEAACIMVEKDVGCLPVLEEGRVVGMITRTDVIAELLALLQSVKGQASTG